jgi:hypothetical protein
MAKPKKINYEVIREKDNPEAYRLLSKVRNASHEEISKASIALAWRKQTKADVDGHLVLGRCVKVTDLYREFQQFDFIIVLNKEVWNDIEFTLDKRTALLDHELCHAGVAVDKDGEPKIDERDRPVFRTRKHDIEEFTEIVSRHGCYKRDLEQFAEVLLRKQQMPLLPDPPEKASRQVAH